MSAIAGWIDDLIKRAATNTLTSGMRDTAGRLTLSESNMFLMFAGDKPGGAVYGAVEVQIPPGTYHILEGSYKIGNSEEVVI